MFKFLRNSQVRLLFSGSLFAVAFVWMSVSAYDVDEEEIRVFLIMSFVFLGILIVAGLVGALLLSLFKRGLRSEGLLAQIEKIEKETAEEMAAQKTPQDAPAPTQAAGENRGDTI